MAARSRKKTKRTTKKKEPLKGKRYTQEQREHTLVLVASGMPQGQAAETIGATGESVRKWVAAAKTNGTMPKPPRNQDASSDTEPTEDNSTPSRSPYRPKDPGQGLADYEQDAIVELKKKHPSYGPAQVRAQLKRFRGWRLSIKAIKRVFKANGFETVHRGSRPEGPEPLRFEAPHRCCVGHRLCDSPSSEVAVQVLRQAISRHGKPEAIRTDRAGAFVANTNDGDFARVLETEMIDHIVGRPYHPQGGGKVEALIGTIRRELWDVEHFDDRATAERRLAEFVSDYNERRAHMGIDGLTPADRFFGRADRVLAQIDAISRKRQGGLLHNNSSVIEEVCGTATRAPVEVLRLCIVDGQMELRFCGARLPLGHIQR
jgi:transposase InsO family protein